VRQRGVRVPAEESSRLNPRDGVSVGALALPSGSELSAALSIVGANNSQTRRLRAEPSAPTLAGRKAPTDAGWSLCCCCRRRAARPRARWLPSWVIVRDAEAMHRSSAVAVCDSQAGGAPDGHDRCAWQCAESWASSALFSETICLHSATSAISAALSVVTGGPVDSCQRSPAGG
jgi:hypothetical protein